MCCRARPPPPSGERTGSLDAQSPAKTIVIVIIIIV